MKKSQYSYHLVFAAACLGMLLFGVIMISLGSLMPELSRRFDFKGLEVGTTLSLLPFGILLGSMVFGPLVDRFGYKPILVTGTLLSLVGFEGLRSTIRVGHLQYAVVIIGIGGGILNGATNALMSDISHNMRSANLSILGVFYGVGALGMPLLIGFLEQYLAVNRIVLCLGLLMVMTTVFFALIGFPKPKKARGISLAQYSNLLKDPILLALGMVLFFQSGLEGIANNWTTTFLVSARHFSTADALFSLSLFVAGLTAARLILGKVLRLASPYRILLGSIAIFILSTVFIWCIETSEAAILGFVGCGLGLAAGVPVILGYVGNLYKEFTGSAFSLVITIALIGNVLINYLMGVITQHMGISVFPVYIFCLAIIMGLMVVLLKDKLKT